MKHEIIKDLDINVYHSMPGLSNSGLIHLLDCPARYYTEYLDANKPKAKKADHFTIGSAVHSMVLEPEKFNLQNYIMPKFDRRTKQGKEDYEYSLTMSEGKNVIDEEQYDLAKAMHDSVMKNINWLPNLLKTAHIEQSFFWVDEDYQVQLKSRPDIYTEDFYIDLKTTDSIANFSRSVYNHGYHRQAALAREALLKLTGIKYTNFLYVVIETRYPYLCKSFVLDEASLDKGHAEFKRGAEIYKQCLETNKWPGYTNQVEQLYLPAWLK